jgi:hypothetical protein
VNLPFVEIVIYAQKSGPSLVLTPLSASLFWERVFGPEEPRSLEFEEEITLWKPGILRNVLDKRPFRVDCRSVQAWGMERG